jgi:hypothetical protein
MSLENFVKSMTNNVVLRSTAETGNKPSIFVRHPKQASSEFDAILPNHTHPAFLYRDSEEPAILIGKYMNHYDSNSDVPCSLPNMSSYGLAELSYNNIITKAHLFGGNVNPMSIADHGLLVCIAHKNKFIQHGNNGGYCGADYRLGDSAWSNGQTETVGVIRIWYGWRWECLIAHTATNALSPLNAPAYWKKLNKVGGTVHDSNGKTYTGSGPLDWYFLNDIANEADLTGLTTEIITGARMYNGEI